MKELSGLTLMTLVRGLIRRIARLEESLEDSHQFWSESDKELLQIT